MKSIKRAVVYGLLVWAIPFIVAMLIFPLRANERPLFESIMPVAVAASAVLFSVLYLQKVEAGFLKEGVWLGVIWLAIGIVIDLLMFSWGPMQMAFLDYLKDIGITYLLIPAITIGFGYLLSRRS